MRKIKLLEHISLDGYVADANGDISWISLEDALFDDVGKITEEAYTAIYGRTTWQMMDAYWPTVAQQPNATKHNIEHGNWYNKVRKIVFSKSLTGTQKDKTEFWPDRIAERIEELKNGPGIDILMIGSVGAAQFLMENKLIDEYHLHINPVLLGNGLPLFRGNQKNVKLKTIDMKAYPCGVTSVIYSI